MSDLLNTLGAAMRPEIPVGRVPVDAAQLQALVAAAGAAEKRLAECTRRRIIEGNEALLELEQLRAALVPFGGVR